MLTTDPTDPRLGHGVDREKVDQNEVYLVLSKEEREKGFVRPYRDSYRHVGRKYKDYTRLDQPQEVGGKSCVVLFNIYDADDNMLGAAYGTQADLMSFNTNNGYVGGCQRVTTMNTLISETYARDPKFYGSTYCTTCRMHLPVNQFVWTSDGEVVGS